MNEKSPLFDEVDRDRIDDLLATWFDTAATQRGDQESWQLIYGKLDPDSLNGPVILLSSSGNCLGGPVVRHLARFVSSPQATVVITGYQPPAGPGARLKELANLSRENREKFKIVLGDTEIPGREIEASIRDLSAYYSGHADENGLVDFILRNDTGKPSPPLTVFLNNGDNRARQRLKERLEATAQSGESGWRKLAGVHLPVSGKGWFDLATNAWLPEDIVMSSEHAEELLVLMREVAANQREILQLLRERQS